MITPQYLKTPFTMIKEGLGTYIFRPVEHTTTKTELHLVMEMVEVVSNGSFKITVANRMNLSTPV